MSIEWEAHKRPDGKMCGYWLGVELDHCTKCGWRRDSIDRCPTCGLTGISEEHADFCEDRPEWPDPCPICGDEFVTDCGHYDLPPAGVAEYLAVYGPRPTKADDLANFHRYLDGKPIANSKLIPAMRAAAARIRGLEAVVQAVEDDRMPLAAELEDTQAEVARLTAAIAVLVDLGDDMAEAGRDISYYDPHLVAAIDAWRTR